MALIRFYEELNYFLPEHQKKRDIYVSIQEKRSVKDLIESLGVPHVEVDLILINNDSVPFSAPVYEEDRVSVYPEFELLNIKGLTLLRPEPLRKSCFILDVHLKSLCTCLRMLGFDCRYKNNMEDAELAEISNHEKRILLTRDKQLLMRKNVTRGIYIRSQKLKEQVSQVIKKLDLASSFKPFTRCLCCNEPIISFKGSRKALQKRVPERVLLSYRDFFICTGCNRIYWKGSHFDKMREFINSLSPSENT